MMTRNAGLSAAARSTILAQNRLAFSLYGELARSAEGNVVCSPASVVYAFAMLCRAAHGATQHAIADALGMQENAADPSASLKEIDAATRKGAIELHLANAFWAQEGYPFKDSFLKALADKFDARAEFIDFADAAGAADAINSWVSDQTSGRISNLVSAARIRPLTTLALVNAVYFAGRWHNEFPERATAPRPFWLTAEEAVEVPTMMQSNEFKHIQGESFDALELPFRRAMHIEDIEGGAQTHPGTGSNRVDGSDFVFSIVLPKECGGLAVLEADLDRIAEIDWNAAPPIMLDLQMPKFKVEWSGDLILALSQIGMAPAFAAGADYSAATDSPGGLSVGAVIHKAFVKADERGAEAAAATAILMERSARREPTVTVKVDRPFLFLIRDARIGAIYFIGRVTDPREKA
jgi:serpin B